jgi:hypothetical protein
MRSMKPFALSASDWTWVESARVAANGMAMSMGHSGWNPKPT